jgi:hypothetical protein
MIEPYGEAAAASFAILSASRYVVGEPDVPSGSQS